ncbi:MAG: serine protease [Verrucomicrobiales bacterium]|nr:serine protease [Verrucomicrobiales bacterium]
MISKYLSSSLLGLLLVGLLTPASGQLVCLPSPHLLTTMPMGAQTGTTVEVTITGQHLEKVSELIFSTPKITAKPVTDESGRVVENKFTVTVAADAPVGVHDARVISRLGVSSPRAFTVGAVPEVTVTETNQSIESAVALSVNSVANAVMAKRSIGFYSFAAEKGKRYAVECAAVGIDSKLTPVVILADAEGRDLMVNRTGGVIDFSPTESGTYIIKVNDLTYQGSERHFYRLALQEAPGSGPPPRHPATAPVSSMSWPPPGLASKATATEAEPNDEADRAQKITLPCDISGSFFPAADVDTYEFTAKKGEVWWVEVASERLGLPTDPFVLVQSVSEKDGQPTLTDIAELYDIGSPVKVSTNGYSYDGPPYNVGSPDVLGQVEIKEDGVHRLQVRDLFGGTRNEPANEYRLIIRKAQPDFALAAWGVHMTLRNGDRAAFSKPMALRAGAAMTLEVLTVRRDGFDGEIQLEMKNLPPGVTATGLKIAKGSSVGHVILNADPSAKPGFSLATISGTAVIDGKAVTRPCRLATMEWPVKDAKQETPSPRLVGNIPVSVSDSEKSPMVFSAAEDKVWEAKEGEKLTIPLQATWNGDFTGTSIKVNAYGAGFEKIPAFEIPLKSAKHDVTVDLAALKVPPGDYTIAFYGGAVAKYSYHPDAVPAAEEAKNKAETEATAAAAEAEKLTAVAAKAPAEKKAEAEAAAKAAAEKQKVAEAAKAEAIKELAAVTKAAAPTDRVDIYVSRPIRISVKSAEADTTVATADKK